MTATINYPCGMRETDIPGWNDSTDELDATCEECGWEGDVEGTFSRNDWGRSRHPTFTFTATCPECDADIIYPDAGPDYGD